MVNPVISVVIPVYNINKEYLNECIESVLVQKGAPFEVIMIDDGSTNGCFEWCDDWAEKDDRISVIHQKNRGVSAARNLGIKTARGEYIIFLDPDDWWEPDTIERLYKIVSENDYDVLFFGFYEEFPNRREMRSHGGNTGKSYPIADSQRNALKIGMMDDTVREYPETFGSSCTLIFKKSVIGGKILFSEGLFLGEDSVFVLNLLETAHKVGVLESALYHYRYNTVSVCKKFNYQLEKNYEKLISTFCRTLYYLHDDSNFKNACGYFAAYSYSILLLHDYFHPDNKEKLGDKKKRWTKLAKDGIFADTLKNADYKVLFKKNRAYCLAAYFTFKRRCFYIVAVLALLGRAVVNAKMKT